MRPEQRRLRIRESKPIGCACSGSGCRSRSQNKRADQKLPVCPASAYSRYGCGCGFCLQTLCPLRPSPRSKPARSCSFSGSQKKIRQGTAGDQADDHRRRCPRTASPQPAPPGRSTTHACKAFLLAGSMDASGPVCGRPPRFCNNCMPGLAILQESASMD